MRVLLDTHAMIWFYQGNPDLSADVRDIILNRENDIFISVASFWEATFLTKKGRVSWDLAFEKEVELILGSAGASLLLVHLDHVQALMTLPAIHKDPFDQMLIAQAKVEDLIIASRDAKFPQYGIRTVW